MTLPTSTRVTDPYETDGVQRDFEFDFPAFYNADTGHYGIEVRRLTELEYEVIDKSLYDIFLNDEDKSGYIRFHVAPMAGDDIYIAGDTTRSQQLNLINYGRYSAQSIEKAFDLIVALIQEFVSKVDEETRQRILSDQALRDFLLIKFNQFTAEVTTKIDKHIGDINGFMSSLIPMFVCIMRKEIANYAETGMQDVIDAKLSDLSIQVANAIAENDAALIRLNESILKIDAATTATAIGARLFDTPAAGVHPVTGVPVGSYFNVRSPNADSYVDEYRNVGGSAVATGKSYPSSNAKWDASQVVDASGLNQQEINTALNSSYYLAEFYGIKPSLTVDISEQIQSLIDYVSSNGGGVIQFGRGVYNIGSGLISKPLVSIVGCGSNSTFFHCNSSDNVVALDVLARFGQPAGSDEAYSLPFLRDFAVINKGLAKKGKGIWLKSFHRCTMSGVTIRGFEYGLDTSGATWSSKIIGNWFVLNKYGIYNDATDANWKFIGDAGVGAIVNTGANGATIAYNEIQGNDFGIFNPYHHGHTAWIAHGLNIDNNIIEGNNFAGIVYTVHNSGINITKNYFERNNRSSTIDLASATLSVDDDATQYAATIIFNSQIAGGRGNIENNHWGTGEQTSGGFDVYAIYHDRGTQIKYSGNNGNVPGFCAKQRSLDYNQAGFVDIGNNFLGSIFDSATESRILRVHRNGSKIPSLKTTNLEATSLSEAGFIFSGTSTTATADLADLPTGFYRGSMFNTSTTGYPVANQICTIEGYKGASYTSTYQRLSFSSGLVVVRRQLANGSWGTPVLETAKILSATLGTTEVAIPHGLNYTPKVSGVVINASASVWQSKAPDTTNVYFTASASVSVDIAVI